MSDGAQWIPDHSESMSNEWLMVLDRCPMVFNECFIDSQWCPMNTTYIYMLCGVRLGTRLSRYGCSMVLDGW